MPVFLRMNLSDEQIYNEKVTILIPEIAGEIASADKV